MRWSVPSILVAYASKYGATRGIADRIADTLKTAGFRSESLSVTDVGDLTGYDAFVIGSAVFVGHWMKEATQFVRRNHALLAEYPVWLFSSGPLGVEETDSKGQDVRTQIGPQERLELMELIGPRDHHVFFGALDRSKLGFAMHTITNLPPIKRMAPDGDYRDWDEIEQWSREITRDYWPFQLGHGRNRTSLTGRRGLTELGPYSRRLCRVLSRYQPVQQPLARQSYLVDRLVKNGRIGRRGLSVAAHLPHEL